MIGGPAGISEEATPPPQGDGAPLGICVEVAPGVFGYARTDPAFLRGGGDRPDSPK